MNGAERVFWISGVFWLVGLILADVASGGGQRPFLVTLLVLGIGALWLITELSTRTERVRHGRRRRR